MAESFEAVLESAAPPVQFLLLQTRALIQEVHPGVVEVAWPRSMTLGYGVGPKKMSEQYCWVSVHKNHVDLGFAYGTELQDPEHILEGTGKLYRHIKIKSPGDLERPAVRALLEQARFHRMPE